MVEELISDKEYIWRLSSEIERNRDMVERKTSTTKGVTMVEGILRDAIMMYVNLDVLELSMSAGNSRLDDESRSTVRVVSLNEVALITSLTK